MVKIILIRLGILIGCSAFCLSLQAQVQTSPDSIYASIRKHREEKHAEMKGEKSPLTEKERKRFKGLKYFPADLKWNIEARFVRTQNPVLFKMKTTTTRLPEYQKYGEVYFRIDGADYKLEVYQSPDISKMAGYEDYLFIPFTDLTNGKETYEVGRYLELRIPEGDSVSLNFNLCYSPYCSYNSRFSCPIPPAVNHLPLDIKAGEKKFHK